MNLMTRLKWMRHACKARGMSSGKAASWSLVGASVGLCLGIGAGTASAQTAATPDVGRLTVDFIYPYLSSDQNLGTFAFPSASAPITVPFGLGIDTLYGKCPINCLAIDLTSTGFDVRTQLPSGNLPIEFVNFDQAIIKVTTLDSALINLVQQQTNSLGLNTGSLVFGDNFFQVNVADAGPLYPNTSASFTVDYNGGLGASPAPVPAPASLPLIASGLAALALARLATRTGVSNRSGRVETA